MTFKKLFYWTLTIAWICLVVYLSTQNATDSSKLSEWITEKLSTALNYLSFEISHEALHSFIREAAHFIVHLVLAMLFYLAMATSYPAEDRSNLFLTVLFCFLLAILDEIIQTLVIGRAVESIDLLLNAMGVQTGAILGVLLKKKQ